MATTAPRSFRRSAKKKVERPVTAFTLDWVEDLTEEQEAEGVEPKVLRSDVFHAKMPTDERLFLVAAKLGEDENAAAEASGIMDLLRDILPTAEFRTLRQRLSDPEDSVDMATLEEVLEWLMEKWSSFPTQQSPVSSGSPTSSGTKSTGRVHGPGSTRSDSPSIAS
jgi:hypothetical protein